MVNEDIILAGKYRIPKNANVVINAIGLHHREDSWENPSDFIPERFAEKTSNFAYLPFSTGRHGCTGKKYVGLLPFILIL